MATRTPAEPHIIQSIHRLPSFLLEHPGQSRGQVKVEEIVLLTLRQYPDCNPPYNQRIYCGAIGHGTPHGNNLVLYYTHEGKATGEGEMAFSNNQIMDVPVDNIVGYEVLRDLRIR